ncbi:hypothetical protein [Dethiosulfovibrio salsuginis]|uniref:DUF3352 domain-containing protein n=1 Tax=Dethiosulfovibrio salsuginis TaxID=561720 RepID=A0A1X7JXT2_9BACT|nr:hypothetical protein [Dethiosulfovibrio salsuginis]SMG32564.1 hypothetical protein SAMN06275492_11737 [Dethiosulfovibrio salsuginis]
MTMNKKATSWFCAIILGLSVLVAFVFFAMPEGARSPLDGLPRPADGSTYFLFDGVGKLIPTELTEEIHGPIGMALKLISKSEKAAFLVDFSSDEEFYGSLAFPRNALKHLKNGEIPPDWRSVLGGANISSVDCDDFGCLRISGAFSLKPIFSLVEGDLVFLASSPEGLKTMLRAMSLRIEPYPSYWSIEPQWDGHMTLDLRGLDRTWKGLGAEFKEGVLRCAWKEGPEGGALKWRFDGLEDLVPSFTPRYWGEVPQLPDPLGSVIGVSDLTGLADYLPESLKGPLILASGGTGSILSVPLSGVCFATFDAIDLVVSEDSTGINWEGYTLKPFSSDWDHGWFTSSPATITLSRSEIGSALGIVDKRSLKYPDLSYFDEILPSGWKHSFLWGYVNGPSLAHALEGIVKSGRLIFPEKNGQSTLLGIDALVYLTRRMRKVGTFSFTLPDISEGIFLWK